MNTDKYSEGQFLNAEMVEQSPSKKASIMDEGKEEVNQFGNSQLQVGIEMDGKAKLWSLSIDHVKTLRAAYGNDSKLWIGQFVSLRVINLSGKKRIVAIPEMIKHEQVK